MNLLSAILLSLVVSKGEDKPILTLESYLEQVRTQNQDVIAAAKLHSAGIRTSREGTLNVLPQLESSASYRNEDFASSSSPRPLNSRWEASAAISERTPVGLDAKIGLDWKKESMRDLARSPLSTTRYFGEVSTDLTRNFLGSATRAESDQLRAASLAQAEQEEARRLQIEADAETTYWEVAVSRLNEKFQADALQRAKKLLAWNQRKSQLELVNQSALAQAQANHSQREVSYQLAVQRLRRASLNFNSLRQVSGSNVEELQELSGLKDIEKLPPREKKSMERNLKAQLRALELEKSQAVLGRSRNTPGVKLYGMLESQSEGANGQVSESFADASKFKETGYEFGVQISTPLAIPQMFSARAGYSDKVNALESRIARIRFLDDQTWNDLKAQHSELKAELENRFNLEKSSEKRLRAEQSLFDRGRTTTFQVVQAEQDYADSQLLRLESQVQVLRLYAQMRLFE